MCSPAFGRWSFSHWNSWEVPKILQKKASVYSFLRIYHTFYNHSLTAAHLDCFWFSTLVENTGGTNILIHKPLFMCLVFLLEWSLSSGSLRAKSFVLSYCIVKSTSLLSPQMRGLVFLSILTILTHIYYKHSRNNQGLLFYFIECREIRKKQLLTLEKIKN